MSIHYEVEFSREGDGSWVKESFHPATSAAAAFEHLGRKFVEFGPKNLRPHRVVEVTPPTEGTREVVRPYGSR